MLQRIEVGIASVEPESLALFWAAALGYQLGEFDSDGIYLDLVPPSPRFPTVFLQRVSERPKGRNRIHIDLYVSDPDETIAALLARGASQIGGPQTGSDGGSWHILADPEGNEFCVCDAG